MCLYGRGNEDVWMSCDIFQQTFSQVYRGWGEGEGVSKRGVPPTQEVLGKCFLQNGNNTGKKGKH